MNNFEPHPYVDHELIRRIIIGDNVLDEKDKPYILYLLKMAAEITDNECYPVHRNESMLKKLGYSEVDPDDIHNFGRWDSFEVIYNDGELSEVERYFVCDRCGSVSGKKTNYCQECGSRMENSPAPHMEDI